jgi:hypothetical protein
VHVTKVNLIVWLVFGVGVVVILICAAVSNMRDKPRRATLRPFNDKVEEYLRIPRVSNQGAKAPGPLKGKVLPINLDTKEVDDSLFFELADDLRPTTPEEVGTLVLLQWGSRQVGRYGEMGGSASVQTCSVVVLDKERGKIVGETEVEGGPPPRTGSRLRGASGSRPTDKVIAYLYSLPRR